MFILFLKWKHLLVIKIPFSILKNKENKITTNNTIIQSSIINENFLFIGITNDENNIDIKTNNQNKIPIIQQDKPDTDGNINNIVMLILKIKKYIVDELDTNNIISDTEDFYTK